MTLQKLWIKGEIKSQKLRPRWYRITDKVTVVLETSEGVLAVTAYPGFLCDGRSGGAIVDPLFPNWGNQLERACVLVHDILFHDFDVSFELSNELLRQSIIYSGYSEWRADAVHWGVSTWIARKAFGCATRADVINRERAAVRWYASADEV